MASPKIEFKKTLKIVEVKSNKVNKEAKYEYHKWKKQLLIADKIISIFIVLFLGIFRPDYVVIAAYFLLIPYLFLTQRMLLFYHLIVSSGVALIWVVIAKNEYGYNIDFITIGDINLYPLFAWAIGLFFTYVLYSHYEHILKRQGYIRKILLYAAFYIPPLIAVETIAYHWSNIHNIATAAFSGLPLCDCIHAPHWMQASYFAVGPIFFTICYLLKLENPHFKIQSKAKEN